jgi:hypothetical protein
MPTAGPIARSGRQSDCVRSHRWGRHGDNQPHQQRPTAAAVMSVGSANGQGPGWESTPPAVRSAAKPTKLWRVQLGLVLVRLSEHPLAVLRPEPPPLVRAVCLCVHPSHRTARPIARSGPLVGPDGGTKAPTSGGAGEIGRESSECRRPASGRLRHRRDQRSETHHQSWGVGLSVRGHVSSSAGERRWPASRVIVQCEAHCPDCCGSYANGASLGTLACPN